MKKIFLIIIITTLSKNINAQIGVPDTLAYLNTVVLNKNNYIGQPFSVLYNNLQIQIKFFNPYAAIHYDMNKETSTTLSFYYSLTEEDYHLTYPRLEVFWQIPQNINQSLALWKKNKWGWWDTAVYNLYKNAIIKDIKVFD